MSTQNLIQKMFPAGGKVTSPVEVIDVKPTKVAGTFVGHTQLPNTTQSQKVVMYHIVLDSGFDDYRVIPAACPHQGADISRDELKPDGNVYCSLHKRPICVFSKFNQAFPVEIIDGKYFLKSN